MTREEFLKLAIEARLHSAVLLDIYGGKITALTDSEQDDLRKIEHFAALIAAAEREECAKVCEERHANGNWKYDTREECARAIRTRGEL